MNCNYCHNTRALGRWDESTPQRGTAWYGIRMVRALNTGYLIPLQSTFPENRLSTEGDGPKIGCATCHKGSFKPLYGASSLKDYPVWPASRPLRPRRLHRPLCRTVPPPLLPRFRRRDQDRNRNSLGACRPG